MEYWLKLTIFIKEERFDTLCYEKPMKNQVIWTYLIFLYSHYVLSKTLDLCFSDVLDEFYIFAVIMAPSKRHF